MKRLVTAALLALLPTGALALDWTMVDRGLSWIAVPVIMSTEPNTPTALDVAPNGLPAPHGVLGVAWVHVCDRNPNDYGEGLGCAVMASSDKAARFGSSSYGAETPPPVEILVGNQIVGRITRTSTQLPGLSSAEFAALRNEIRSLRSEVRSLRRQLGQ